MRKTAILNLNTNKIFSKFKRNFFEFIFLILFIFGLVCGGYIVKNYDSLSNEAKFHFEAFLSTRINNGFFKIFLKSLLDAVPYFFLVFISGTSLVGVVIIPLTIILKGIEIGVFSGFIYSEYLLKGIAFNALFFVPVNAVIVFALILCSKISFSYAVLLAKISLPNSQLINLSNNFQNYYKKFSLTVLLLIISSTLDAIMSSSFLGLFNF